MFKNNLKVAWRNLMKNRYISAINFIGLVVGMTSAIMIWKYVAYENSYDSFHVQAEDIYRVRTDRGDGKMESTEPDMQFAAGAACAGPFLKEKFPEIEGYVKLASSGGEVLHSVGDKSFVEKKATYATNSFFEYFSFNLLKGDPKTCLAEPFTVVLSESQAKKYFGEEDPIGKDFTRRNRDVYKVTGVFEDPPANSHLKFDILLSYESFKTFYDGDGPETAAFWDGFYTYLKLKPGTDWQALEAKIPSAIEETYGETMTQYNAWVNFHLQPLPELYLTSNYLFEAEQTGNKRAVNFLMIIGGLILLIAWFNYVNMATARSEMRAKEVGIRKVVGSTRGDLIQQFMLESGLLNLGAIAVAFSLSQLLSPVFERFVGKQIDVAFYTDPLFWLAIFGVFVIGTVLAGLYPSIVLSSFKPIDALKNTAVGKSKGRGAWMRKGLVIGQFAASVILISGTIVIYKQLSHLQNSSLGIDIDKTLVVKAPAQTDSTYQNKYVSFENNIKQLAAVEEMTGSTSVPGQEFGWTAGGIRKWGAPDNEGEGVHAMAVDFSFPRTYGMELEAGRLFMEDMHTDTAACVINETAVRQLKFKNAEEAIGVDINFWDDKYRIVGVVKDFNQESPKYPIEPLIMKPKLFGEAPNYFSVKLNSDNMASSIAGIEQAWNTSFSGLPFEYFFLDDHFAKQHETDRKLGNIFGFFSMMAIFVSCLGLFALAAFMAERKTKEIGIRKVLGASVSNLVGLLSKEFLIMVCISILIAVPLGYWVMNQWLDDFVSRIQIQWWVFALAGIIAIIIAFVTVGFQSFKAASTNPVTAIKSE